jgi:mono/diheme cytochrome c family protein
MTRRSSVRWLASVALATLVLAVVAIGWLARPVEQSQDDDASGRFGSATGPVPATPQRPGDPTAGYRALVNAPYVGCGLPYRVYRRLSPKPDPEDLLPGREGRNAELPYDLSAHVNADGVEIVSPNCLTCHASRFEGELVVGLGNEFLDFTQDPRSAANDAGLYVRGDAETAAWQRWADRIEGIAPYIQTSTLGANPATNLTWALMAHRDPRTLEWSPTPLLEPPPREPLPLSVPPWWRMQKKNAMFYTTIGRGDHARFMIMASMLCADSVKEAEAADAYAPDMRAFIESLRPPDYPFSIDAALAERGRAVFETNCSQCHGTYGEDASYPNLVIPLDVIGTDPDYALTATDGSLDRFYDWVTRSYYGASADMSPTRGYIAPPLDGIWATAPYLHNGSVPDLRSLLASWLRPELWQHQLHPRTYDPTVLGWKYEWLRHGKSAVAETNAKARVYDTTLPGYGNGGHLFGDDLEDGERTAIIEYLKTL